jgi:glutathione S-transferase
VHPLGKSPILSDGDATMAESGAIIEYLASRHGDGRLLPREGSPERRRYTYWLHYAEGSAMPPLLLKLIFDKVETGPMPFFVRPIARAISRKVKAQFIQPQIKTHFDFIEAELGRFPWFAGPDFTAADVQMSFPLEAGAQRGATDGRPRIKEFLTRIHARPAYARALERGGKYDYA